VGSTPAPAMQNLCIEHLAMKNQQDFLRFFEELKNISNRVAWFAAELCKAEKGVAKDKRNHRRT
jgi:hypothetical protein